MKISKHFSLAEAVKSQTAIRNDIDNTPSEGVIVKLRAVAENILEPPRVHFGRPIVPSSWFRCAELNTHIGGAKNSQHVLGEAVDFELPGTDNLELIYWMVDNTDFDKLILEFYEDFNPSSGWVHATFRGDNNRRETYTKVKGERIATGLP